jgi:catecholate siderophore receptor
VENLADETYFPNAHNDFNISTGAPINARFTINARF